MASSSSLLRFGGLRKDNVSKSLLRQFSYILTCKKLDNVKAVVCGHVRGHVRDSCPVIGTLGLGGLMGRLERVDGSGEV